MNQKAEKSGVVFGFAITSLVFLCLETLVMFILACISTGATALDVMFAGAAMVYWIVFLLELAGLITTSIFINKYNKLGYDMKTTGFGVVFIVFACLGWGEFIWSLVAGIVTLCNRRN